MPVRILMPGILALLALVLPGDVAFGGDAQTGDVAVNAVLCTDVSCETWETIDGATISAVDPASGDVLATCATVAVAAPEGCQLEVPDGTPYRVVWDTSLVPSTHPVAVQPFTVEYAPVHPNVLTMGFAPPVDASGNDGSAATGNTLEIKVWDCPAGTGYGRDEDSFAFYYDACAPLADPIGFAMTDSESDRSQRTQDAWVTFQDVATGAVWLAEDDWGVFDVPVVACNDGETMEEIPFEDGIASLAFDGTRETLTCDWFNIRF